MNDTQLIDELYNVLTAREGANVERTIRHILRHVDAGIALVGIAHEQPRVVCFDPRERAMYRVPVSRIGLHVTRSRVVGTSVDDIRAWRDEHDETLAWVHPRYR